jgi:pimeloyl-ACP methyl ester carboxylesterase
MYMLILLIFIILCALYLATRYIGADTILKVLGGNSTRPTILLFPGLGNKSESFNWNQSTQLQREKTGLPETDVSLQQEIETATKIRTVCIDIEPEGTLDDIIANLHNQYPNTLCVVGHSIGGAIAHYYGEKYSTPCVLLDPTPEFIFPIRYNKVGPQYDRTRKLVEIVNASKDAIYARPFGSTIIYSSDDNDPMQEKKVAYFDSLAARKIQIKNATHWVHVTNPQVVVDEIMRIL